tara:strand:- start:9346 stop:10101 length:756 start_codon:yes stop_codon:yes gene_type:complete
MRKNFINRFSLKEQVVIVTGSNRGNGFAIASGIKEMGANVIRLDLLFDSNQNLGTHDIIFDLNEVNKIKNIIEIIHLKYGKIDALVNNAGVSLKSSNPYDDYDTYLKTLNINLNASFNMCSAVAPYMKEGGKGSIVNITSLGAERGFPDNPSYQISKAGLKQATKAMARDWGNYNIRVNNICPGYIRTMMTEDSFKNTEKNKERLDNMIIKRWGNPEDLIGPVAFLLSDASAYITGSDIYVDGGWICNGGL